MSRNYERAKALLTENGQFLETLARELKERESIDGSELRQRLDKAKAARLNQQE